MDRRIDCANVTDVTSPLPLAALVLAGGASRRMGRDKATVVIDGPAGPTTLVERVVSIVGTRCAPVYVVAAPGQALPDLPAVILRDEVLGVGPLLATGRGLRAAAESEFGHAFVCAVDMPELTTELIETLIGLQNSWVSTSSCLGTAATTIWPASTAQRYSPPLPDSSLLVSEACAHWWMQSTLSGSSCPSRRRWRTSTPRPIWMPLYRRDWHSKIQLTAAQN